MKWSSRRLAAAGSASLLVSGLVTGVGAGATALGSATPAKARARTLVYVTPDSARGFVIVRQDGTKLIGVAGVLNTGNVSCVRGTTRSGKLQTGNFKRATGRGSGSAFRVTKFIQHLSDSTYVTHAMVPTTIAHLNVMSGMDADDGGFMEMFTICRAGGSVGER